LKEGSSEKGSDNKLRIPSLPVQRRSYFFPSSNKKKKEKTFSLLYKKKMPLPEADRLFSAHIQVGPLKDNPLKKGK